MVEELLNVDGEIPPDYKYFCINGQVAFIQFVYSRLSGYQIEVYTPNWEPLDESPPRPSPAALSSVLEVAEKLSAGIDFVRVDLYDIKGRVVFGEMTIYPAAGYRSLEPPELFSSLAQDWEPCLHVPKFRSKWNC
jgi:hypothetical protein